MDKVLELKVKDLVKIKNRLEGITVTEAGIVQQELMERYGLDCKEAKRFMDFAWFSTISDGNLHTEGALELITY